jgi:hypothetical protein
MDTIITFLNSINKDAIAYFLFGAAGGLGGVLARIYTREKSKDLKTRLTELAEIAKGKDITGERLEKFIQREGRKKILFDFFSVLVWTYMGAFAALAIDFHIAISFMVGLFSPILYSGLEKFAPKLLTALFLKQIQTASAGIATIAQTTAQEVSTSNTTTGIGSSNVTQQSKQEN